MNGPGPKKRFGREHKYHGSRNDYTNKSLCNGLCVQFPLIPLKQFCVLGWQGVSRNYCPPTTRDPLHKVYSFVRAIWTLILENNVCPCNHFGSNNYQGFCDELPLTSTKIHHSNLCRIGPVLLRFPPLAHNRPLESLSLCLSFGFGFATMLSLPLSQSSFYRRYVQNDCLLLLDHCFCLCWAGPQKYLWIVAHLPKSRKIRNVSNFRDLPSPQPWQPP